MATLGLSNKGLARAIDCDVSTATRWRNGHRLPTVEFLDRLRLLLGMNHEEIMKVWRAGNAYKAKHGTVHPERNPFGIFLRKRVFNHQGLHR